MRDSVASAAVQHGPTGHGRGVCDVDQQADVLLQQGAGHAGEPGQTARCHRQAR